MLQMLSEYLRCARHDLGHKGMGCMRRGPPVQCGVPRQPPTAQSVVRACLPYMRTWARLSAAASVCFGDGRSGFDGFYDRITYGPCNPKSGIPTGTQYFERHQCKGEEALKYTLY